MFGVFSSLYTDMERTMAHHYRTLLAIDPGLSGTGWAVWYANTDHPSAVGVIPASRYDDLSIRCGTICSALPHHSSFDSIIVCEFPEFQEGAQRSMGWRKGDLQKLTFLVGYIAGRNAACRFVPVKPSAWKGQLPKTVVADRITDRLGQAWVEESGVKTHAWDAVGIGLWFKDLKG